MSSARDHEPSLRCADAGSDIPRSPLGAERQALFLAAQHCQGGHSAAGAAISDVLGVSFPLRMTDLITKLREEGQNPAAFYPWMIRAQGIVYGRERGRHPFFTDAEIEAARDMGSRVAAQVDGASSRAEHDQ